MYSNLRNEFRMRRFLKKASPIALILLIGFAAWFGQMVVGISQLEKPVVVNYYHVK